MCGNTDSDGQCAVVHKEEIRVEEIPWHLGIIKTVHLSMFDMLLLQPAILCFCSFDL